MNDINEYTDKIFEEIKHIDEEGIEYWLSRELQQVLEYTQWRRFASVIEKAKTACDNSKININDHFAHVGKTIKMPKGATKNVPDFKLSRYACYLIVQNADPRKNVLLWCKILEKL